MASDQGATTPGVVPAVSDEGRVERWAREMCRLDDMNPDQPMSNGYGPWWRAYENDASGMIAFADAESVGRLAAQETPHA